MTSRREFTGALATGALATGLLAALTSPVVANWQPKRILLRSSWQVVNIGDIAHTPGVLALIEKHLPGTEVRLWASPDLTPEVAAMEHKRFPQLKIVKGTIDQAGRASNRELSDALEWCDFLLHGSGPSLVAMRDVSAFVQHTGKPFGVYGITYAGGNAEAIELLGQAKFVFFRDSVSLDKAKSDQVRCPVMEFGPDGAFACDLRNDQAAESWLAKNNLKAGQFACCLTRARHTPYWLIRDKTKVDPDKDARNQQMFEHDQAPLRRTISEIVRQTDLKVVLCPEDKTQVAISRQWLYDKLPDDVRKRVIWRDSFWLTDEALSTYVRSAGVFGLEMHSPIMSVGNGIPAVVGRFAEQTSKGFMWRDIGLGAWLFDFDQETEIEQYPAAVLKMLTDREESTKLVNQARVIVHQRQTATMKILESQL